MTHARPLLLAALAALAAAPYALRHADAQSRPAARRAPPPARRPPPPAARADAGVDAPLSTAHVVGRNAGIGSGRGGAPCVAERGCPAPRAVPAAPDGVRGEALDAVWDRRLQLRGRRVAVAGTLRGDGGCTEMACDWCCNHCQGAVTLRGTGERYLALGAQGDPRFACAGDDSGLCCGTEVPDGPVIVVGTLAPVPGSGGAYRIETPTLYRAR